MADTFLSRFYVVAGDYAETDFERTVRERAHQEALASPRYREEYERRQRFQFVWRLFLAAMTALRNVSMAFGLVILPFVICAPVYFVPVLIHIAPERPPITIVEVALWGALPLSIAWGALLLAASIDSFYPKRYEWVASLYPVDEGKLQRDLWRDWRYAISLLIPVLAFVYAAITTGILTHAGWRQWLALAISVPLNLIHGAAMFGLVGSWFRPSLSPGQDRPPTANLFAALAILAIFVAYLFHPALPPELQTILGQFCLALPSGWASAVVYWTIVEPQPVAIAFLVLFVVSWQRAWRWFVVGISVREYLLSPKGTTPVFERGLRNSREIDSLYDLDAAAMMSRPTATAESVAPRLRAALAPTTGRNPLAWVARWWLTSRERTILEHVLRAPLCWGLRWLTFAGVIAVFTSLFWAIRFVDDRSPPPLIHAFFVTFIATFAEMMVELGRLADAKVKGSVPATHPLFPIDLREFHRAIRKYLLLKAVIYVPLPLALGWIVGDVDFSRWEMVIFAVVILAGLSMLETILLLAANNGLLIEVGNVFQIATRFLLLFVVSAGVTVGPLATMFGIAIHSWWLVVAGVVWYLVVLWGVRRYTYWRYYTRPHDFAA